MNSHTCKPPRLLLSAKAGTAILMFVIAVVALTALATQFIALPASAEEPRASVAAIATTGSTVARARRCPDCGVVESMRDVAGTQTEPGREITIRLQDGSMRVITDANPAKWRQGERVSIIPGTN